MFNFLHLSSLVKRNEHCRMLFKRTAQWENNRQKRAKENECSNANESKDSGASKDNTDIIHWKKSVKIKFENEEEKVLHPYLDGKDENKKWLHNWEFESLLRRDSNNSIPTGTIFCKICDEPFETRQQLSQHKRFKHFPSWEGGSLEFCFVPYFVEPKRFNLLRGTLVSGQPECGLCRQRFHGNVKEKMGPYLENLRAKLKEKTFAGNAKGIDGFLVKSKLKVQMKKVKNVSKRVCELCSKILSNRKGLERHMLIHTGEKPYPCDMCGKPFRRKDNCVRHKKTAHLFKTPRKARRRKVTRTSALTTSQPSNAIDQVQ